MPRPFHGSWLFIRIILPILQILSMEENVPIGTEEKGEKVIDKIKFKGLAIYRFGK